MGSSTTAPPIRNPQSLSSNPAKEGGSAFDDDQFNASDDDEGIQFEQKIGGN